MQAWWAVFSGSENLDLTDVKEPVAIFKYKDHATQFKGKYGPHGYVEAVHMFDTDAEAAWLEEAEKIWSDE